MGCAFNHTILDGSSTWHFMSSWAQICSGSTSISVQPILDRTNVRRTHVKPDLTPPPSEIAGPSIHLSTKNFKFSEATINRIKSKVNANGSQPFSTLQSFATHVWQAVTHARQLNPEDHVIIGISVDCRKRVVPPLPESYFGNMVQGTSAMTTAGELTRNPPAFGAEMIRKAIEAHGSDAIGKVNVEWEMKPRTFQYTNSVENKLIIASSPRFKVYDMDFGWGKPEGVRSGLNTRADGMVYLYQGKSGGVSMDADISLEVNAMKRLEKDKDFLMGI